VLSSGFTTFNPNSNAHTCNGSIPGYPHPKSLKLKCLKERCWLWFVRICKALSLHIILQPGQRITGEQSYSHIQMMQNTIHKKVPHAGDSRHTLLQLMTKKYVCNLEDHLWPQSRMFKHINYSCDLEPSSIPLFSPLNILVAEASQTTQKWKGRSVSGLNGNQRPSMQQDFKLLKSNGTSSLMQEALM